MTKESVFFREKNKKRRQRGLDKGRRIKKRIKSVSGGKMRLRLEWKGNNLWKDLLGVSPRIVKEKCMKLYKEKNEGLRNLFIKVQEKQVSNSEERYDART